MSIVNNKNNINTAISSVTSCPSLKEEGLDQNIGLKIFPSKVFLTAQDIAAEQTRINNMLSDALETNSVFQKTSHLKVQDLADPDNLFQFLLLFNHPLQKIHNIFTKQYKFFGGAISMMRLLPLNECCCNIGRRASIAGNLPNMRFNTEQEILKEVEKRWVTKKKTNLF